MVVLVLMVVAAPAAMTMLVMVVMSMIVLVIVMLISVLMTVSMILPVMVMPMIVIAMVGAALRLEGALDRRRDAALPAHQLRKSRIILHVEGVARDLGLAMLAAEMPGQSHEAQRVLGSNLQQALGRCLHLHEPPILEPQGVAVVDGGFHVEIEQDLGPALPFERRLTATARRMIERHRIDDTVGLHGGLTDDGGDAGHGFYLE
jgi:hypothetical protein